MELRAEEVAAADDCGNRPAVIGAGDGRLPVVAGEAVGEIDVIAGGETDARVLDREPAPAHVRHRPPRRGFEPADAARDEAEAGTILLLAGLEQDLHPEADAEHRLGEAADHRLEAAGAELRHRVAPGADAGEDDLVGARDGARVRRDERRKAEPSERDGARADIAAADVDDHRHKTPLVLGTASPSRRRAWRRARPKALKQASVLWWSLSPVTRTWMAAPRLSARLRNTWGVISVG